MSIENVQQCRVDGKNEKVLSTNIKELDAPKEKVPVLQGTSTEKHEKCNVTKGDVLIWLIRHRLQKRYRITKAHLPVPHWDCSKRLLELEHFYIPPTFLRYETEYATTEVGLDDLFGDGFRTVLVVGNSGYGKSALCSKIAFDWASLKYPHYLSCFQLLFVVSLNLIGDKSLDQVILDDIALEIGKTETAIVLQLPGIFEKCKTIEFTKEDITTALNEVQERTLIILDGYGHSRVHQKVLDDIFKSPDGNTGLSFSKTTILVTAQPFSSANIFPRFTGRFFVRNFTEAEKERFSRLYFPKDETKQKLVNKHMHSSPFALQLLCLYYDAAGNAVKEPRTVSDVYRYYLNLALQSATLDGKERSRRRRITGQLYYSVGKRLYKERYLIGDRFKPQDDFMSRPSKTGSQHIKNLSKVDIFSEDENERLSVPHSSLLEFFVAVYLRTECLNYSLGTKNTFLMYCKEMFHLGISGCDDYLVDCGVNTMIFLHEINKHRFHDTLLTLNFDTCFLCERGKHGRVCQFIDFLSKFQKYNEVYNEKFCRYLVKYRLSCVPIIFDRTLWMEPSYTVFSKMSRPYLYSHTSLQEPTSEETFKEDSMSTLHLYRSKTSSEYYPSSETFSGFKATRKYKGSLSPELSPSVPSELSLGTSSEISPYASSQLSTSASSEERMTSNLSPLKEISYMGVLQRYRVLFPFLSWELSDVATLVFKFAQNIWNYIRSLLGKSTESQDSTMKITLERNEAVNDPVTHSTDETVDTLTSLKSPRKPGDESISDYLETVLSTVSSPTDKKSPVDELDHLLDQLQTSLRMVYSEQFGKMRTVHWEKENRELSLDQYFTEPSISIGDLSNRHVDGMGTVKMSGIFLSKSKEYLPPKRILLTGDCGSGKTSLCTKLATDWVKRKSYISHFSLVIFLFRKRHKRKSLSEEILSVTERVNFTQGDIISLFEDHQEKVLLILDGYDEECFEDISELVCCKDGGNELLVSLRTACVLFTCRPQFSKKIKKYFQKELMLKGFSRDQQIEYISKYFGEKDKDDSVESLVKSDAILALCESPILLQMLCLCQEAGDMVSLPPGSRVSLTSLLYECFLHSVLNKRMETVDYVLDNVNRLQLTTLMNHCLCILGRCYLQLDDTVAIEDDRVAIEDDTVATEDDTVATEDDTVVIEDDTVATEDDTVATEDVRTDRFSDCESQEYDLLLRLELLEKDPSTPSGEDYIPSDTIHERILEYCAALYLCTVTAFNSAVGQLNRKASSGNISSDVLRQIILFCHGINRGRGTRILHKLHSVVDTKSISRDLPNISRFVQNFDALKLNSFPTCSMLVT